MTDDSPFDLALKIRNYGDALAHQDILACEVEDEATRLNLSPVNAAETFHRRQQGVARCEHQEPDHNHPLLCAEDAKFLGRPGPAPEKNRSQRAPQ